MTKTDDNYVFPSVETIIDRKQERGMSLRDYFAGQALAGIWANASISDWHLDKMAEYAYDSADAMLEARKK